MQVAGDRISGDYFYSFIKAVHSEKMRKKKRGANGKINIAGEN